MDLSNDQIVALVLACIGLAGAILAGMIGVGGAIVGALVGHGLSENSTRNREERETEEQAKSARIMIQLEAQANLELLKDLVKRVTPAADREPDDQDYFLELAKHFALDEPLDFRNENYLSQLQFLPKALRPEVLVRVVSFYGDLEKIASSKRVIASIIEVDDRSYANILEAQKAPAIMGRKPIGAPPRLLAASVGIMGEVEKLAQKLIKAGNPVSAE